MNIYQSEEDSSSQSFYNVKAIKDHRRGKQLFGEPSFHKYELLVSWECYNTDADTWQPLEQMYEDASESVEEYFTIIAIQPLVKEVRGQKYWQMREKIESLQQTEQLPPVKLNPGDPRMKLLTKTQEQGETIIIPLDNVSVSSQIVT